MATRYRLSPTHSRFTVHADATGVLSFFAHSPTFTVRDFAGSIIFEDEAIRSLRLDMTINAASLELLDKVRDADREDIEGRMRREVLETGTYHDVRFQARVAASDRIAQGRYQLQLDSLLALHGTQHEFPAHAQLLLFGDGVRLRGECPLRLSDYQIRPVTALGGAIRLKDELKISFDLAAVPEEP